MWGFGRRRAPPKPPELVLLPRSRYAGAGEQMGVAFQAVFQGIIKSLLQKEAGGLVN